MNKGNQERRERLSNHLIHAARISAVNGARVVNATRYPILRPMMRRANSDWAGWPSQMLVVFRSYKKMRLSSARIRQSFCSGHRSAVAFLTRS